MPFSNGKGRAPSGNEYVGEDVQWDEDSKSYKTENGYYWHGTFLGGWSKEIPPPPNERSNETLRNKRKSGEISDKDALRATVKKGRKPSDPNDIAGSISWDDTLYCWVGSKGVYWYGTNLGGWNNKAPPPKIEREKYLQKRNQELGIGPKRPKARPPGIKDPKYGKSVSYNHDENCYQTNAGYYWHGTFHGGWKTYPKGKKPDDASSDEETDSEDDVDQKQEQEDDTEEEEDTEDDEDDDEDSDDNDNDDDDDNESKKEKKKKNKSNKSSTNSNTNGRIKKRGRPPRPRTVDETVEYDENKDAWKTSTGYYWHGTYKGGWKKKAP